VNRTNDSTGQSAKKNHRKNCAFNTVIGTDNAQPRNGYSSKALAHPLPAWAMILTFVVFFEQTSFPGFDISR
jgi:hypothetical protein